MILSVSPVNSLKGSIQLPASKSYSIRAFIIAACGGSSSIIAPSDCDDALVAKRIAKLLGAQIQKKNKDTWQVVAHHNKPKLTNINVGESGTVLRFVLPLASLSGVKVKVNGEGTLIGRPNRFLNQTLRDMGMEIYGQGEKESVPIHILGGTLKGGKVNIDASLSSQFISALLITCPQLEEDTTLTLEGKKMVSVDYIIMTLQILKEAGINIRKISPRKYVIKGSQKFKGLKNFKVPSDYGLAAFSLAAAALLKSNLTLRGALRDDLIQADGHIIPLLKKMGVRFEKKKMFIKICGPFELKGGEFSLKDCPDLVPIMSILALFAKGKTRLYDIHHARAKESDRIRDLRNELLKIGAKIIEKNNEMIIEPQATYRSNCILDPHHDHRLAMSFSVLGLRLGIQVKDIECVSKSYPGFVRDFKSFGAVTKLSRS